MPKQALQLNGPAGGIEAMIYLPEQATKHKFALVCHPDPLQEGTMHNKIVTTVARTFENNNIPCITFNYRGVGASEGSYGNIIGEVQDCLAVITWIQQQSPGAELYLVGFSFGAYIAAAVATQIKTKQLISIAPSVERMPYFQLAQINCPWLVIQGEEDEIVPPQAVYEWFAQLEANKTLIKLPATGHFFHGKLLDLQQILSEWLL